MIFKLYIATILFMICCVIIFGIDLSIHIKNNNWVKTTKSTVSESILSLIKIFLICLIPIFNIAAGVALLSKATPDGLEENLRKDKSYIKRTTSIRSDYKPD